MYGIVLTFLCFFFPFTRLPAIRFERWGDYWFLFRLCFIWARATTTDEFITCLGLLLFGITMQLSSESRSSFFSFGFLSSPPCFASNWFGVGFQLYPKLYFPFSLWKQSRQLVSGLPKKNTKEVYYLAGSPQIITRLVSSSMPNRDSSS